MIKRFFIFCCFLGIVAMAVLGVALMWGYLYVTRDLPHLSSIEDYQPAAVTQLYASDGTLVGEFFPEEGKRYPVKLHEVPLYVRNAFLAAEDATFYTHPGIDLISIARAFVKNIETGSFRQGGSTITQQVVKNLLLTRERKIERKVKEAILSYRIEQMFSKDDILEMYLNEIYFGNNSYGLKAAAQSYFKKEVHQLSLGEAAMLAGLPKAPSRYSPARNFERARRRQRYVLNQMVRAGFITAKAAHDAAQEEFEVHRASLETYFAAPYYLSEVRRRFEAQWPDYDIDRDGLEIYTALDVKASELAHAALRKGLRETDKRRGWRGPLGRIPEMTITAFLELYGTLPQALDDGQVYPAMVESGPDEQGAVVVVVGKELRGRVNLSSAKWARRMLDQDDKVTWVRPSKVVVPGDIIEVAKPADDESSEAAEEEGEALGELVLAQTPELQGAVVLLDPQSGLVVAAVGGYDFSASQFNRTTQSLRQPGSAFKPIVYLAAVDGFRYTPTTVVYDVPQTFRVGTSVWSPANFDNKFLGGITLRTALQKSRNLVSADITSRIGVDAVIQYARKLGIESPLGRNLSISLGSSEVTVLEMTRAYGVFPAEGYLFPSVFITRVVDRTGREIFNYQQEQLAQARQVIDENSAFVMAYLMKGVVQRGTGWRVRALKRPAAGKTGTSNDQMDAWFIGYTPEWVCGVWAGFDQKRTIGAKETGGRVSAPIWLYLMQEFLQYREHQQYEQLVEEAKREAERLGIEYVAPEELTPPDFTPPDGIDPYWVDRETGYETTREDPDAILEYFLHGTKPRTRAVYHDPQSYLESPDL